MSGIYHEAQNVCYIKQEVKSCFKGFVTWIFSLKFSFLEISFIFLSKYFEWEYYFWNEVWYQLKNFNTTIVYFRIKTKMINTKQLKHKTAINAIFVQNCILLVKHNCNPRESLHNCLRHQHLIVKRHLKLELKKFSPKSCLN